MLAINDILKLPKHQQRTQDKLDEQMRNLQALTKQISELRDELGHRISSVNAAQTNLEQVQNDVLGQLSKLKPVKAASKTTIDKPDLFANDHLMDKFYTGFEDRFRGAEDVIETRLEDYLPYFKESSVDFTKNVVLDIGSGRGEFISLLKKNGIKALGLDINFDMVERSNKKGLPAEQGDAVEYLQKTKPGSLGAITGFHIVEHIPFALLMRLFTYAYRALAEGGFVIFETPNPENVVVGSSTFRLDPSHLNPLPPDLLSFTLETCGFKKVEILRLHPDENFDKFPELPEQVRNRLFGPRDYAVVAYK